MPFDGTDFVVIMPTPAKARKYMIGILNNPITNWEWDFSIVKNECGTAGCAIGIAASIWGDDTFGLYVDGNTIRYQGEKVAKFFGITRKQVSNIFDFQGYYGIASTKEDMRDRITPKMVAAKLMKVG